MIPSPLLYCGAHAESVSLVQGKAPMRTLPWYGMIHGFAVVPRRGSISANAPGAAVVVLMEFGHVILFELPDLNPNPLSLPLQELPELTHCMLAESASASTIAGEHSVTLNQLKVFLQQRSLTILHRSVLVLF